MLSLVNLAARPSPSLSRPTNKLVWLPSVVIDTLNYSAPNWIIQFSCVWPGALPDHTPMLYFVRDLSPWGGPTTNLSVSALLTGANIRSDTCSYYGSGGGDLDVWAVIDREGIVATGPKTRYTLSAV